MASQVPPSTKPTPAEFRPLPPAAELYEPEDYKEAFAIHKNHKGVSKVGLGWGRGRRQRES